MREARIARERQAWIAAVAVLATSLAWLALINAVLLARAHGIDLSAARVVVKVLTHAALRLAGHGALILPAAAVWAGTAVLLAPGPAARARLEGRAHRV